MGEQCEFREEFSVIHAPGWPGGIEPWPQTRENAERFVRENGGRLRHRFVSEWEAIEVERGSDGE